MCNVCCAGAALHATERGAAHRFRWNPTLAMDDEGLLNNPDAPPVEGANEAPAHWPYLYVQAEGEAAEGPGRVRFAFAEDGPWSTWYEDYDLAGLVGSLGVDVRWGALRPEARAAILARDVGALSAHLEARRRVRVWFNEGMAAARASSRAKSVDRLRRSLRAGLATLERELDGDEAAVALVRGLRWGLQPVRKVTRRKRPARRR